VAHEALDASFHALIEGSAPVEIRGSGFEFTEGPVWRPRESCLMFSDIVGNARYRWTQAGVSVAAKPSSKGNGMTFDSSLRLLVCEHITSSVTRFAEGRREVLATHYEGKELNSPNDIVVDREGAIYFSDPTYGRMPRFGEERETQLGFQGVYRLPPEGGAPALLVEKEMFEQPNGLCFSPDEKQLYVNDTKRAHIYVFDVAGGTLRNARLFASGVCDDAIRGRPDGMKCDAAGNIWVTGPGGLWVYNREGALIGKVAVPEYTANFHWGMDDWRTLFITASTSLYSVKVKIGPHVEPFMRA
jgi:gluconolactonase